MKTNKKIAIIGAHGVGKSTIWKSVKGDITKVVETFPLLRDMLGLPFDKPQSSIVVNNLACYVQKQAEEIAFEKGKPVLCDRCVLDIFAYAYLGTNKDNSQINDFLHTSSSLSGGSPLEFLSQLKEFDKIYFIKISPEIPLEQNENNTRMMDIKERKRLEDIFEQMISLLHLKVEVVNQRDQKLIITQIENEFR